MILLCYLFLLFLILTVVLFIVFISFVSFIIDLRGVDRSIWHASFMLIGSSWTGVGLMIFRLLPGLRTRVVKYFHLVLQTMSVIFMLTGFLCANSASEDFEEFKNRTIVQELPSANLHIYSDVHKAVGRMTLIAFGLEYFSGCLLYTCIPISPRVRILTAPIHDVLGLWIFLCLISAVVTGVYLMYDMSVGYWMIANMKYRPVLYMNIMFVFIFGASVIVLNAVICPYFDWEFVGNM